MYYSFLEKNKKHLACFTKNDWNLEIKIKSWKLNRRTNNGLVKGF